MALTYPRGAPRSLLRLQHHYIVYTAPAQSTEDTSLCSVLLLAVYILLERPEGATIGGDNRVLMEIEARLDEGLLSLFLPHSRLYGE